MAGHVYGPVPSRRLGRSLGVDLVPQKTCSFNCVYCQLGPTPEPTLQRAEYVPVDQVVQEVKERLAEGRPVDYVTLGGSGEPTLHSSFGRVAEGIGELTRLPIALLTNGALFWLPEVRRACRAVDVVIPSLDAGDEETFQRVSRPHEDLTLEKIVGGVVALRDEFPGQMWLEVFLVLGVNSSDSDVAALKRHVDRIRPDRVQLNTAVRPPAEGFVQPVPAARLAEICTRLGPGAEVIADVEALAGAPLAAATCRDALEMLRRRPCTLDDVATGLAIHRNEATKYLRQLAGAGDVVQRRREGRVFYCAR